MQITTEERRLRLTAAQPREPFSPRECVPSFPSPKPAKASEIALSTITSAYPSENF